MDRAVDQVPRDLEVGQAALLIVDAGCVGPGVGAVPWRVVVDGAVPAPDIVLIEVLMGKAKAGGRIEESLYLEVEILLRISGVFHATYPAVPDIPEIRAKWSIGKG